MYSQLLLADIKYILIELKHAHCKVRNNLVNINLVLLSLRLLHFIPLNLLYPRMLEGCRLKNPFAKWHDIYSLFLEQRRQMTNKYELIINIFSASEKGQHC